jgi:uncharacterized protein (TIGR02246 family)
MSGWTLLFGMMGIVVAAPGDNASHRFAIQQVLDAHGNARNKGDAVAAAAVMTEDADWVSGAGDDLEGRPAIEAAHREWLSGEAKGSRHAQPDQPKIRFIRSDVASWTGTATWAVCAMNRARKCRPLFRDTQPCS